MTEQVETGQTADVAPTDDYTLHSEEVAKEKAASQPEPQNPDAEDSEESESQNAPPKKKGGFQKKIERKNQEIASKDQEIASKDQENAQLRAELERLRSVAQQPKQEAPKDGPPDINDFTELLGPNGYNAALIRYEAKQEAQALLKADKEASRAEATRVLEIREWEAKTAVLEESAEVFRQDHPDFDQAIEAAEKAGLVTPQVVRAVVDSDIGVQLSYYLATNPAELQALHGLSEKQFYKAIGRIESKLEGGTSIPAKTTKAPPPISPVKSTAKSTKSLDELPYEEYNRIRTQQERERRG